MSDEQSIEAEANAASAKQSAPWRLWLPYLAASLVLAVVAGLAALMSFTPRYTASHLLEPNNEFILYKNVMPSMSDLAQTEAPIVLNSLVLEPVLSDPRLRSAPSLSDPAAAEENLRKNLSISLAGSSARMMIQYTDTDRDAAAKICNAIASSYLSVRAQSDQKRVNKLESLLSPEIDHWKNEVERLSIKRDELTRLAGVREPVGYLREIEVERFKNLSHEVFDLEKEIEVRKAIDRIKDQTLTSSSNASAASAVEAEPSTDPTILEMETRLGILKKHLSRAYAEMNPSAEQSTKMQFLKSELGRATDILEKLEQRAAEIRTERRQMVTVRSVAEATPPRTPINADQLHSRLALSAGVAFLVPLLIGALRPTSRD